MAKQTVITNVVAFIDVEHPHVLKFFQHQLSCDCPAWKFQGRSCKHTRAFQQFHNDAESRFISVSSQAILIKRDDMYSSKVLVSKADLLLHYPEYFKEELHEAKAV